MEPGEFDLVGFAVGVVERKQRAAGRGARRATSSSASPVRGCGATATRSRATRAARARRPPARRARVAGRAPLARRRAAPTRARSTRPRCGSSARHVDVHAFAHVTGGGIPGNLARVLGRDCDAVIAARRVGGAADLRRDPGAPATSPTTRWSTCSTSASACWPLSPQRTASIPSTRCARRATMRGQLGRSSEGRGGCTRSRAEAGAETVAATLHTGPIPTRLPRRGSVTSEVTHGPEPTPEHEQLLTPSEVAAMFRVNPKTVTRWARAGKISAIRTLGGHRRFKAVRSASSWSRSTRAAATRP